MCAVLIAQLPGCVTEYSGGSPMSADLEATLNKRVALARQYIGVGDWENAKRNLELAQEIDPENAEVFDAWIKAPEAGCSNALTHIIPIQLLAYKLSVIRQNNPDMPRNLAKSVTVE